MAKEVQSILIVRLGNIGDIVNATSILRSVRAAHPNAQIDFLTQQAFRSVIESHPALNRVISPATRREAAQMLRGSALKAYDLILDCNGSFWRRPERGFSKNNWRLVIPDFDLPATCCIRNLIELAGVPAQPHPTEIVLGEKHCAEVEALQQRVGLSKKAYIAIHPCTTRLSKDWPVSRFQELLPLLSQRFSRPIVLMGTAAERNRCAALFENLVACQIVDLMGRTSVAEMLGLHRDASLVISGDTGAMHAAAAFQTPFIALLGPSMKRHLAPLGDVGIILQKQDCDLPFQHFVSGNYALPDISAEEVLEAAEQLLGRGPIEHNRVCSHSSHRERDGVPRLYELLRDSSLADVSAYYGNVPGLKWIFAKMAKAARGVDEHAFRQRLADDRLLYISQSITAFDLTSKKRFGRLRHAVGRFLFANGTRLLP